MSYSEPDGYLAVPSTDRGAGVLVLHPWWGLNNTMRAVCDQLAEHGYIAFAADLYHGKLAETIPDAEKLSNQLDDDQIKRDLADAIAYLCERTTSLERGLAVIGFSLGTYSALELSVSEPELIRTVVIFYGTGPGDFSQSKADYLGHFAETDEYEPSAEVDKLEAALRSAGRPVKFHRYPNTGHWFFEPDRTDAFDPAAAQLAWERTLVFLKETLQ